MPAVKALLTAAVFCCVLGTGTCLAQDKPAPSGTVADDSIPVEKTKGAEVGLHTGDWPWVTVGAGAILAAVGGCFHYDAYKLNVKYHDKAERLGVRLTADVGVEAAQDEADAYYDDMREEHVKPRERAAWVLYGVGGAAVLGGLVWFLVTKDGGTSRAGASGVSYTPAVGPDNVGFQMQWTF